ncbi:membrane-bound lytic murein transglycosylase B [Lutimaribacter pacificus]|uniref:Membrane-bound lytic murein transglycosylase B n=1 Tax=Lutimaribacter pacificus TaxID=391948 RepID=A0A1H0GCP6_9RHOB|nr:lytic murein transglycosylase [Lutimaribacter pacificus]SDO04624.1 membrane-bound lytic murein transglycosylase B [Lutimaribacter pacificus]SHJ86968.1 membrane-bound lytic murein transglycosylase B [Lutimaribacter pacificus]
MRMRFLLPAMAGVFMGFGMAVAGPVDQSPRPQLRPFGAGATATTQDSLRPALRPADLNTDPVVSTKNAAFQRWVDQYKTQARSRGIGASVVTGAFRGVRYNADVIAKDRNQAEFKKQIWDYLDNAVSSDRVDKGQRALRRHRRTLERIEQAYGVEKEVVTAVWGLETYYGEKRGTLDVIEAMATLAFDGRRGAFFEKQLFAALQILQSGDVAPRNMQGSWAGAMGHTQFIPTSYLAYAVDFTGDGKRDIWSDDPADALASTAAYLRRFGWKKGQPWGVEVRLPQGFAPTGDTRRMPSDWAARGVVAMSNGRPVPDYGAAAILLPAGTRGAAFMVFDNFNVIKRYNNADAYAIGVGHLADRIAGGPPIQAEWPRGYKPLNFDQRKELQTRLKRKGLGVEKIDGIVGPNTIAAIRAFQQSVGVTPDGYPSQNVLHLLRRR